MDKTSLGLSSWGTYGVSGGFSQPGSCSHKRHLCACLQEDSCLKTSCGVNWYQVEERDSHGMFQSVMDLTEDSGPPSDALSPGDIVVMFV